MWCRTVKQETNWFCLSVFFNSYSYMPIVSCKNIYLSKFTMISIIYDMILVFHIYSVKYQTTFRKCSINKLF